MSVSSDSVSSDSISAVSSAIPSTIDDRAAALDDLHFQIMFNLAQALASATSRIARAAGGQSVFNNDADSTRAFALLKTLPAHLDEIGKYFFHLYDLAQDSENDDPKTHP